MKAKMDKNVAAGKVTDVNGSTPRSLKQLRLDFETELMEVVEFRKGKVKLETVENLLCKL